jgi:cation transport regulator
MYYDDDGDLPDSVHNNLPPRARRIYREAFNDTWRRGSDLDATEGDPAVGDADREQRAHAAAWKAVRAEYKRCNGRWVRIGAANQSSEFPQRSPTPTPAE